MLVYWIPETTNTLPANASHRVSVGAIVVNDKKEVLALIYHCLIVLDKCKTLSSCWHYCCLLLLIHWTKVVDVECILLVFLILLGLVFLLLVLLTLKGSFLVKDFLLANLLSYFLKIPSC